MKEIVFNQFNNTKKNHYIPQTILRKFADEKQQLFVHDKQNNNSFSSSSSFPPFLYIRIKQIL